MNAVGRKWMAKELYEVCPVCDGEGEIPEGKFGGGYEKVPTTPGNIECPGCSGDRFVEAGLTVRQLEVLTAKAERYERIAAIVNPKK